MSKLRVSGKFAKTCQSHSQWVDRLSCAELCTAQPQVSYQTQVQAQQLSPSQTRSWLCFLPVTTTRTTRTPTKIYQNEVYYRLGIWNINLTHKTKTSPTIPWMLTHRPKDSHLSNSTRSLTLAQPSSFLLFSWFYWLIIKLNIIRDTLKWRISLGMTWNIKKSLQTTRNRSLASTYLWFCILL